MKYFSVKRLAILGIVLGLLTALAIGTALAQTPTPTPSSETRDFNIGETFLGHLAQNLGIDRTQLLEQIRAAARSTVDDAVQQGALTTERAARIKERIDQNQWPSFGPKGFGRGHGRHWMDRPGKGMHGIGLHQRELFDAVAQKLGVTVEELQTELRSGKSLATLAEEKGVSRDDLRTTLVDAARARLDEAVQAGRLTQERADAMIGRLESQVDRLLDATMTRPKRDGTPSPTPSTESSS